MKPHSLGSRGSSGSCAKCSAWVNMYSLPRVRAYRNRCDAAELIVVSEHNLSACKAHPSGSAFLATSTRPSPGVVDLWHSKGMCQPGIKDEFSVAGNWGLLRGQPGSHSMQGRFRVGVPQSPSSQALKLSPEPAPTVPQSLALSLPFSHPSWWPL